MCAVQIRPQREAEFVILEQKAGFNYLYPPTALLTYLRLAAKTMGGIPSAYSISQNSIEPFCIIGCRHVFRKENTP